MGVSFNLPPSAAESRLADDCTKAEVVLTCNLHLTSNKREKKNVINLNFFFSRGWSELRLLWSHRMEDELEPLLAVYATKFTDF